MGPDKHLIGAGNIEFIVTIQFIEQTIHFGFGRFDLHSKGKNGSFADYIDFFDGSASHVYIIVRSGGRILIPERDWWGLSFPMEIE